MPNELQIFNYDGNDIRSAELNGEPALVLADVCKVLELQNPSQVAGKLDEDEKGICPVYTPSGDQEMLVINEPGLYKVVLRSDKPQAKPFMRWVTHEVLPSIRKHGAYLTDETVRKLASDPRALGVLLCEVSADRDRLREENESMKPKALFADAVSASEDCVLVRELSKFLSQNGIDIGEKRLYDWLRSHGFLIRKNGRDYNSPSQRAMKMGLFRVKEDVREDKEGRPRIDRTTVVTGKGQQYFLNKFLAEKRSRENSEEEEAA